MSDYVSGEDIEAYCGQCPNRKQKISRGSGRPYDFCQSFSSPVFKVINLCKDSRSCSSLWQGRRVIQTKFKLEARQ